MTTILAEQDSRPVVELSRIRRIMYRLRLAVRGMNYASRRVVELQAPWVR